MRLLAYLGLTLFAALLLEYIFYPFPLQSQSRIAIIGGGLAGLSAALTAAESHPHLVVELYEKEDVLGGNSKKATSGINAVNSEAQAREGVSDSYELFARDTLRSGRGSAVEGLVDVLVHQSTSAIEFLQGYDADLGTLSQLGGHSVARTHRSDPNAVRDNVGRHIIGKMIEATRLYPNLRILLNTRVTSLIKQVRKSSLWDFFRRGKRAAPGFEVHSTNRETRVEEVSVVRAVVFTSGGFGADTAPGGLLDKFAPSLSYYPTTNGQWSTGDGLKVLMDDSRENLRAQIVDMQAVQVHPTGLVKGGEEARSVKKVFLAPEALRGSGGLLLTAPGERFVSELGTRDFVTAQINAHCPAMFGGERRIALLILNQEAADRFGLSKIGFYSKMGFVAEYENVEALCEAEEGLDPAVVKSTFEKYALSSESGEDEFGKKTFPALFGSDEKLYRMFVTPSIHYTMGGVLITEESEVVAAAEGEGEKQVISGLYAAGEVTGGVHGKNRLGGNSLLGCVVFGRIAGRNAAEFARA